MISTKLIVFYILMLSVFIAYVIYILNIYKQQFILNPLTFIKNKDTIFLITQNLYCYDNIIQVLLEKGPIELGGNFIPKDWKNKLTDIVRSTNEGSQNEYALYCKTESPTKLESSKLNNSSNSVENEIIIEIFEDKIQDIKTRPKDTDGNLFIFDGDIVSLKFANDYYIGSTGIDSNDFTFLQSKTQPNMKSDANNIFAWVIKIDKFYSENRFANKIANCACVYFEPYLPLTNTITRISTNCDISKQTTLIFNTVKDFLGNCLLSDLGLPTGNDKKKCTFEDLLTLINSIPRERTIRLDSCSECYHWQIRQKKLIK